MSEDDEKAEISLFDLIKWKLRGFEIEEAKHFIRKGYSLSQAKGQKIELDQQIDELDNLA
ncbi:MAG: hypothetical protein GF317_05305 [Candidatus Lokiarchaeota archaeon]|nr:hypothetical protein [Candidatus Lokiarchaeota archaeon]MBD3199224.1 hypothetical protein [Candidatus Lokiarchaeota archaeon]